MHGSTSTSSPTTFLPNWPDWRHWVHVSGHTKPANTRWCCTTPRAMSSAFFVVERSHLQRANRNRTDV